MRKLMYLVIVVAALGLIVAGCGLLTTPPVEEKYKGNNPNPYEFNFEDGDLVAGQNTKVGEVIVSNDANNLYITYETTDNWVLVEMHLAVVTSIGSFPTTKTGNPKVGLFPYGEENILGNTWEETIALPSITAGAGQLFYIAAQAEVENLKTGEKETAWGYGERFTERGNWATHFKYTTFIPPSPITLSSIGDATAEWSTDESYSGNYSVKLTLPTGCGTGKNAEVQIFVVSNPTISEINSWSFWTISPDRYTMPIEFNVDTTGDGIADTVIPGTTTGTTPESWFEETQDTISCYMVWNGSGYDWLPTWADVQEAYGDATLLRVDLGYGPLCSNQAITAYVDYFTINDDTYDFEQ